jgi:RNA polymerase sigma-70 factor, ECF subfamily
MVATVDQDLGAGADRRLSRDAEEFRAFYGAALPRVYGYLLHRCGSSATAEDLTQETFLAAVVELRKARQVEEPLGWILGIARHKLLDHYRRQDRGRSRVASEVADAPAERPVDSDGRAITALASVPSDQRIALVLRHVDGLSVPEVAAALGRSVEAAESLLARGRVRFRQAYMEVSS